MPKPALSTLPDLDCACANLRRAARLVTQLYSQEMGRQIEPAQFALLSALRKLATAGKAGITQTKLGQVLGLDKTTLSRNLSVLQRNGWIQPATSADRREKSFLVTPAGDTILNETKPGWQRAQAQLLAVLSPAQWQSMSEIVGQVAEAALAARSQRTT